MQYRSHSPYLFSLITILLLGISGGTIFWQHQAPSTVIITEFLAVNNSTIFDEDGDYSDWIELYNRSDHPVNLSGWALTNDSDMPTKWTFPNITLASHDYLVVFASGKNRRDVTGNLHTNFKLNREGEYLALYNVLDEQYRDDLTLEQTQQFQDVSFGRQEHGTLSGYLVKPSPGMPNGNRVVGQELLTGAGSSPTYRDAEISVSKPDDSSNNSNPNLGHQLYISEIMYNPVGGDLYEFIELKNGGIAPIHLATASFEGIEFMFPYTTLPLMPQQTIVLARDATAFAERYPDITVAGIYDGQLSNDGETITLRSATGTILASLDYDDEAGWPLSADGQGDSLELTTLTSDMNLSDPHNWQASTVLHGTPGQ